MEKTNVCPRCGGNHTTLLLGHDNEKIWLCEDCNKKYVTYTYGNKVKFSDMNGNLI